ncbi:COG1470 family protein [Parasporobacterium paucivorans]|uniref:NPCBM-associated, NEW3 domain of alpha-galactosidase n=1 Tax=Parasporobacterium paucivorans DSM 15970 TaxID=1122934 RepID=A0A1M6D1I3_9FIRM|nr:NEW3 domain-containing protein [Parasporobacterium paucivorans]SHI67117.1 NPCBM-associated, NEW3 domain of alpha-galactosidase [Parasporobacterium paucivorans DSM 15970]
MNRIRNAMLVLSVLALMLVSSVSTVFAADASGTEFLTGCNLTLGESKAVALFIRNDDAAPHVYKLTTEGSANSYELYFSSNGAAIKNVTVPAGTSSQVDVNITLNGNVSVIEDKLSVKAVRDDGKENVINLSIMINKDYALSVKSMLDKIDILSGKSGEFTFSVTNNGSKDLNNIKIKPELPYKWVVSQGAETTMNLKPGETGTATMKIDVPSSQAAGNFTASFTAASDETSSIQVSIPATVKTSSNIAYWAIGILVLIAAFTVFQFKRHGRR